MSTTLDQDLLKAAEAGDLAGVDKALRGGAHVDVKDEYHNTPLNEAAIWGHAEVVKRLLEAGADIENKGSVDLTPLGLATTRGHSPAAQILLDSGARVTDDVLSTIQTKVNILEENAEAGMVTEEAVKTWKSVLDFLVTQRLGQDLPDIAADLMAADAGRRANAAQRVAEAAKRGVDVAPAASALVERLADADAEIRNCASAALTHHLARAGEWKRLCELLESSDVPVRTGAAVALASAAQEHADAALVAPLGRLLEDGDPEVRRHAALTLSWVASKGIDISSVLPAIIERLADADGNVRRGTIVACYRLAKYVGLDLSVALPAMRARLDDENETVRQFATQIIELVEGRRE